jgi:LCP family protein required for cell wall assembly
MDDKNPTAKRTTALILVSIFLLIIVIAGVIAYPSVKVKWTQPLGPGLELPTHTPTLIPPTATSEAIVQTANVGDSTVKILPTDTTIPSPSVEPSPTPEPLCGGPPVMYVLAVGADNRDDNYLYGLADVIRIVRVDFVTPKVTVLSLPRDLWVEIPGISDHYGITHGKLNQAYFYGGEGMGYYDGPGEGPGLLARTLDLNYSLRADHYGAVNMQTFVNIVDAVGGIDIYLPTDIDGTPIDEKTENMGYFYAGQQNFTGDEALRFARIRKKYNDFTRMDNQNMVLCSLQDKLLSPAVLPKLPQIAASFHGSVQTDLSLQQISQMACLLPKLTRENLIFTSLPEDILESSTVYSPQQKNVTYIVDVDNTVIRDYLNRFMAGTWPDKPDQSTTCP